MSSAETALVAAATLVAAVTAKAWAAFSLMGRAQKGRRDGAFERRLYRIATIAPLVACGAIVALAAVTGLWWLEASAALFAALVLAKTVWAVRASSPRPIAAPRRRG
jgi:hypothetical protein